MKANILYINESTYEEKREIEFYIEDRQEKHLIRVRDPKQMQLLYHLRGVLRINRNVIEKLKNDGFQYFDSVEEYDKWYKEDMHTP